MPIVSMYHACMTQRTRQELTDNINADIADNTQGDISAGDVRENMKDVVDSAVFPEDPSINMTWRNVWQEGVTYNQFDVVRDAEWAMVANKETTDRAAPASVGDPIFQIGENVVFATQTEPAVIAAGQEFIAATDGVATQVRVWPPEVGANIEYFVQATIIPVAGDPTQIRSQVLNLVAGRWNIVSFVNFTVSVNTRVVVELVAVNSNATTTFNHPWQFQGTSTSGIPSTGGWNRKSNSIVRIHKFDNGAVDRSADLGSIVPSSTIEFTTQGQPSRTRTYNVFAVEEFTNHYEYEVSLASSEDSINVNDVTDTVAVIPTANLTQYVEDVDYWSTNSAPSSSTTNGVLTIGTADRVVNNNAYGVDIKFQQLDFSDDWDLLSTLGSNFITNTDLTGIFQIRSEGERSQLSRDGVWRDYSQLISQSSYQFSSDTSATDPTTARVKFNNADVNLATELYLSDTTLNGYQIGDFLGSLDDGDAFAFVEIEDQSNYAFISVTGPAIDNGGWFTVPINVIVFSGVFPDNDDFYLSIIFLRGRNAITTDYDNSASGLVADNVKDALDELALLNFYESYKQDAIITTTEDFDVNPQIVFNENVVISDAGSYIVHVTGLGNCNSTSHSLVIDLQIDDVSVLQSVIDKEFQDSDNFESFVIRKEQALTPDTYNIKVLYGRRGGGGADEVSVQDVLLTVERVI